MGFPRYRAGGGCGIRGFTLVELTVTLAILTVLTVIGVPGIMGLVRDSRLSTNTDMLINALNSARIEAVKRRTDITVCPVADPNGDSACVADASLWSNGAIVLDGATVVQRIIFAQGVTVTSVATEVVINGTLGSSTASVTFQLCATGRRQQEVEIAMSGHVKKTLTATTCS